MVYTGISQLDEATRQFENKIKRISDSTSNEISKIITKQYSDIYQMAKLEILGKYKEIAYKVFQETFLEKYGRNFDVNSLNRSLSFSIDNNLCPHLSYNVNEFQYSGLYKKDKKRFNQNANIDNFVSLLDSDEIEVLGEVNLFDMELENEDPFSLAEEEQTVKSDKQIFARKEILNEPKEVYKEALSNTEKIFSEQIQRIKNDLFKTIQRKYGIKLI